MVTYSEASGGANSLLDFAQLSRATSETDIRLFGDETSKRAIRTMEKQLIDSIEVSTKLSITVHYSITSNNNSAVRPPRVFSVLLNFLPRAKLAMRALYCI